MNKRPKASRRRSGRPRKSAPPGWPALRPSAALDPRELEPWHLDFEALERADPQHVHLAEAQRETLEAATAGLLSLSKAWRSGGRKQQTNLSFFRQLQDAYAAGGLQGVQKVIRPFLDEAATDERRARGRGGRGFFARLPSGWLSLRELRSAAAGGKEIWKCLQFFIDVSEVDAALAKCWGDETARRSAERGRRMYERVAEKFMGLSSDELKQEAAKLVPILTKHYKRRFGRRGNQNNPWEDAFIRVADRIWHDAGGRGKTTYRKQDRCWKGGPLDFVVELMGQADYEFASFDAIGQRIYKFSEKT